MIVRPPEDGGWPQAWVNILLNSPAEGGGRILRIFGQVESNKVIQGMKK